MNIHTVYVIIWLCHVIAANMDFETPELKTGRYCQFEEFTAECRQNEAIIMEKALYGRMELDGVCVKRDYGYVGCQTDVRHLADVRCSGRPECRINIPDPMFDRTNPCPDDLKLYLEASYRCVPVEMPPTRLCTHSQHVQLKSSQGYISSYITSQTGCGAATAPWRITLEPGQKVNISLIDFASHNMTPTSRDEHCRVFAIIKDLENSKTATVCGFRFKDRREHHVMVSTGRQLEIRIMSKNEPFLLKYQAIGCPDLRPPRGGWFKRDSSDVNRAQMGCDQDGSEWTLTCRGFRWSGTRDNCSRLHASVESMGSLDTRGLAKPSAFIIVIGIALVIGCCILVIGLLIIKRRYGSRTTRHLAPRPSDKMTSQGKEIVYMTSEARDSGYTVHPPLLGRDTAYADENEYAYVEDYQRFNTSGVPGIPQVQQGCTFASGGPATPPRPAGMHVHNINTAPPTGSSAELYHSLDGSQHRYADEGQTSPTRVHGPNAYHVLDTRDDVNRTNAIL